MTVPLKLKINDFVWYSSNSLTDILKFKVIAIKQYDKFKQYIVKAQHKIGVHSNVTVILDNHNNKLRYVGLESEHNDYEDSNYVCDLDYFLEGTYRTTFNEARLDYYDEQEKRVRENMYNNKKIYEESEKSYERVKVIIKDIKELINATHIK